MGLIGGERDVVFDSNIAVFHVVRVLVIRDNITIILCGYSLPDIAEQWWI